MKEIFRLSTMTNLLRFWGHSSAGRAPAWHAGGQEFESPWLHLIFLVIPKVFRRRLVIT